MPSLSFQKQFADPILAGTKRQTIRAPRKQPIRAGQMLYMFTGLRTKHARRLGEAKCVAVQEVMLDFDWNVVVIGMGQSSDYPYRKLTLARDLDEFARADGFQDWGVMATFWKGEDGENARDFSGYLHRWEGFVPA